MNLIEAVLKLRSSGYPSGGEVQKKEFNDGSTGFHVESGGFKYVDRYHGFNPFAGSELLFDSRDELLWVMHYYGEVLSNESDPEKIYSFLREALLQGSYEYPFRGPANLEIRHFKYENRQYGSFDRFHGTETIFEKDNKVYRLYYHGGRMKKTI